MDKSKFRTRTIFEAVAFREVVNPQDAATTLQAFMCKNLTTDPAFCNFFTTPRLFYLQGESNRDVSQRSCVKFGAKISRIEYVSLALDERLHADPPEMFFSQIFLVHLTANPLVDAEHRWFSLDNLPLEIAKLHREKILPRAANFYKQTRCKIAG